jgi:DNA invertase Pin-like site-specific DNA recombinase
MDSELNQATKARPRRYVAYYRVSTGRQELSGIGLDAQREAVQTFLAAHPGRLVAEYSEALSGRKNNRQKLDEAIRICRVFRATLVIARLDRLSRNVEMITRLMEGGLDYVATDFPHANRFTIHILAAVAEYESNLNSERMKLVLATAKARGGSKLGVLRGKVAHVLPPRSTLASNQVRQVRADARARDLAPGCLGADRGRKVVPRDRGRIEQARRSDGDAPRAAWLLRERDFQPRSFDGRRIWLFAGGEGGELPRAVRDEAPSSQHAIGPLLLHSGGTSYAAMASELHERDRVATRRALEGGLALAMPEVGDERFFSAPAARLAHHATPVGRLLSGLDAAAEAVGTRSLCAARRGEETYRSEPREPYL